VPVAVFSLLSNLRILRIMVLIPLLNRSGFPLRQNVSLNQVALRTALVVFLKYLKLNHHHEFFFSIQTSSFCLLRCDTAQRILEPRRHTVTSNFYTSWILFRFRRTVADNILPLQFLDFFSKTALSPFEGLVLYELVNDLIA
jgi:hypothetical protein